MGEGRCLASTRWFWEDTIAALKGVEEWVNGREAVGEEGCEFMFGVVGLDGRVGGGEGRGWLGVGI